MHLCSTLCSTQQSDSFGFRTWDFGFASNFKFQISNFKFRISDFGFRIFLHLMTIQNLSTQPPFTTKDGSTIRSILDRTNAPVANQSLAEASLPAGAATQRHYHRFSEEIYFLLAGTGLMEIDGATRAVTPGDAILIPPGAWHQITATSPLRFLCCCAPPYSHGDTVIE
jgi:mannose-6-phosphate isomerase-like protein (cupin superfamily)